MKTAPRWRKLRKIPAIHPPTMGMLACASEILHVAEAGGCTFPLCATLFLSFPFLFSLLIRGAHVVHQRETFCAEAPFFVPQLETALLEHSPSCQEKPSFFWIILAISTTFLLGFLHTSRTRSVFHISLCVRTSSFPFYFHSVLSFSRLQEFATPFTFRPPA